jgi:hypothetical protein
MTHPAAQSGVLGALRLLTFSLAPAYIPAPPSARLPRL